eukprot:GHRR01014615.1.p1 GENE.GHRR01014615.1~~GHRR01014615.1.p1  ORF type:complete len:901 (+),score=383.80 GHRR01014615.1:2232-4934(+)
MSDCALSMLTALGDEINNMDKSRRKELVAATSSHWADIAALAERFIPEHMVAGTYGLVHGALVCLQSWLRLSTDAGTTCRLSPGQLAAQHPAVLTCLFGLLGTSATEPVTAERIEGLACEMLCELLGPGTAGTTPQQERAAVDAAAAALLGLGDIALTPGHVGARVARCVAAVASALAQRDAETICGCAPPATSPTAAGNGRTVSNDSTRASGGQHVLPLAELMLHCIARPEREVCEAAVEYFLMVNTLPSEARHPQMVRPLYASLLQPLVHRHARYPAGFSSWNEEVNDDEEAFHRFRDQSLSELLETVYLMTGPTYLTHLQDTISTADMWQAVEGALYCLKAVACPVKNNLNCSQYHHLQQSNQLVQALLEDLCSPAGKAAAFLGNPYTCATAAGLVGAYAAWFAATTAAPLEGALRLSLHALCFAYSWHAAALAFRALCVRCAAKLCSAAVFHNLAAVAVQAVAPAPQAGQVASIVPMPLEDRQAVVDGLAHIVTCLNPQDAAEGALSLQQPHLTRTKAIIAHGSTAAAQGGAAAKQLLVNLADELQLIAVLVKGMEFPGQHPAGFHHPAMKLLEAAWPVLSAVAEAPVCQQDRAAVEAVCEVYKHALQTARGSAKPLLSTLLKAVGDMFTATHQPACLDLLAAITEVFGEAKNAPDLAAAQRQAFDGAVLAASNLLVSRTTAGQPLSASGELLRSLLAVGDAHLVFARELMLSSAALPAVFEWAVAAAGLREKEPASAAFSFLSHLLAAAGKVMAAAAAAGTARPDPEQQAAAAAAMALQASIAVHGEPLTWTVVAAVCDTAPRQLLRAVAGVLYQLLHGTVAGSTGPQWLLKVLQSQDLPGMAAGLLKPSDCETFAKLALRQPPLPRGRFDAMLMDFAAIARGEGTSDALLAYEL